MIVTVGLAAMLAACPFSNGGGGGGTAATPEVEVTPDFDCTTDKIQIVSTIAATWAGQGQIDTVTGSLTFTCVGSGPVKDVYTEISVFPFTVRRGPSNDSGVISFAGPVSLSQSDRGSYTVNLQVTGLHPTTGDPHTIEKPITFAIN